MKMSNKKDIKTKKRSESSGNNNSDQADVQPNRILASEILIKEDV